VSEATDLIIFGAKGDLSARKLFPALYHLDYCDLLPKELRLLAVAREQQFVENFLADLKPKVQGVWIARAGVMSIGRHLPTVLATSG